MAMIDIKLFHLRDSVSNIDSRAHIDRIAGRKKADRMVMHNRIHAARHIRTRYGIWRNVEVHAIMHPSLTG